VRLKKKLIFPDKEPWQLTKEEEKEKEKEQEEKEKNDFQCAGQKKPLTTFGSHFIRSYAKPKLTTQSSNKNFSKYQLRSD
jgi:hypothetical protein